MVRLALGFALALLLEGAPLAAQSHPAWWTYASPEATALVGIEWSYLRGSPFGAAVAGELSPDGSLGFPDLACLSNARQILISSPATLAIEYGTFPADLVREQALAKNLKASAYKGVALWVTPGRATLSVAQISDNLLLLGLVPTLRDAIDRSMAEPEERVYSPLLARAARFAKEDLWVVATQLPDPLASRFVPIDAEAESFEGSVSLWDGLHLVAAIEAPSGKAAEALADSLAAAVYARPAMTAGTKISIDTQAVYLVMDLTEQQLEASMHAPPAQSRAPAEPPAQPAVAAAVTPPAIPVEAPAGVTRVPPPAAAPPAKPPPPGPRVIRIFGLEEGTREIPMRP